MRCNVLKVVTFCALLTPTLPLQSVAQSGGDSSAKTSSIVFYSTGNINECEYVEVRVSKEFGSDHKLKDPIVKTFKGVVPLPYDEQTDVTCGMEGAATIDLPPGQYYFTHRTVNCTNAAEHTYTIQWRTLESGVCTKVRLSR